MKSQVQFSIYHRSSIWQAPVTLDYLSSPR